MKTGFSKKLNQSSPLRTALLFLLALVLIASAVLSTRLSVWTENRGDRISLSSGSANSILRVWNASQGTRPLTGRVSDENYNIHDDHTVWQTETEVNIFQRDYMGKYSISVSSVDGDKVVAPGTEGTYRFTVENTSTLPMYYELTFESWNKGFKYQIPLEARVSNEKGEYLFGSKTAWADFNDLAQAKDSKTLDAGKSMTYTLDWRWTFEREAEDWLDTALGNQSAYNEFHGYDWIECGVRIMTTSEIDEPVPETTPSPRPTQEVITPPTPAATTGGRAWALVNLICTVLASGLGIHQLVVSRKKHEDDEKLSADENERLKKLRKRKIWDVVPGVASIVTFILTEDIRQPMTWVDKWTLLMVLYLAGSGLYAYLTRLKAKEEDKETVGTV